jgi:hypothetical protein
VIFVKQALNCVVWVPYEEKLICGCGKSGTIEIFQLVEGRVIENTTKDKVKVQVQTQMQINKSKYCSFGCSDDSSVFVYFQEQYCGSWDRKWKPSNVESTVGYIRQYVLDV